MFDPKRVNLLNYQARERQMQAIGAKPYHHSVTCRMYGKKCAPNVVGDKTDKQDYVVTDINNYRALNKASGLYIYINCCSSFEWKQIHHKLCNVYSSYISRDKLTMNERFTKCLIPTSRAIYILFTYEHL